MITTTDIVKRHTIETMCQAFQDAVAKYKQGYQLIKDAEALVRVSFECSGLPWESTPRSEPDKTRNELLCTAWRRIFELTGLRGLMSLKDQDKLSKQLSTGEGLPDLVPENVLGLISELSGKMPELIKEAVKEVFEMIRPRHWNHYKTNDKNEFRIGNKYIWSNALDTAYTLTLRHHTQNEIRAFDNVFRLLDGKGPVTEHYSETIKAIEDRTRMRSAHQGSFETTYFKVKYFKNGNLHFEFKRMDLVAELNRIGAEGRNELGREVA